MTEMLPPLEVPLLWEQGFGHDPEALSIPLNVDGSLVAPVDGPVRLTVGAEL
jgi:muramoyltetrapeptide carboxypeptidase